MMQRDDFFNFLPSTPAIRHRVRRLAELILVTAALLLLVGYLLATAIAHHLDSQMAHVAAARGTVEAR